MEVLAGNISYMDKNEVSNLIDSYKDLPKSNPRKALVSAQDAYTLCTNLDFEEGKIKALILMGESLYALAEFDLAKQKFYEALSPALEIQNKKLVSPKRFSLKRRLFKIFDVVTLNDISTGIINSVPIFRSHGFSAGG